MGSAAQTTLQRYTIAEAMQRVSAVDPVEIAPIIVASPPTMAYAAATDGNEDLMVQPTNNMISGTNSMQVSELQP